MPLSIPVSVLGATGVVGQRFVARLAGHPLFRLEHLAASERSSGRRYAEACSWRVAHSAPYAGCADRTLVECTPARAFAPLVFSALDAEAAREIEPRFAAAGALVFSNASTSRMEADVPLLVPEVNPGHLALLERQRIGRGWNGGIVCNPNCTAAVLVMALAPLSEAFGIEQVLVTSFQAASGAGHPGVPSLDLLGNVLPYIPNEEAKVAAETQRMLGRFTLQGVEPLRATVSAACHRVAVVDGHTLAVSVKLSGNPTVAVVREAMESWRPEPQRLGLPSAPAAPLRVHDAEDRPQPRLDVDEERGMTVHVGRLRPCAVLGIKFCALGHNLERGAAGGSVLNAELAHARGWF